MTGRWTALILAGQRPGPDPLAAHFDENLKALVPLVGEAMVTRVVRTLSACPAIGQIIVLAQDVDALAAAVAAGGPATLFQSGSGISRSILSQTDSGPDWPYFVTTADHPLLTPEIVDSFLTGASECDVAIGMVEARTLLAAYPGNKRTWLKFSDGHWSGANLFALNSDRAKAALKLWAEAEQDRKKVWKLFLHFGPWLAFRAITRTIGLGEALTQAGKRLGLSAKLVALPFAEAAIDVDKLSDHALAKIILAERER